ncbi:DgyrCDS4971 [Dimorphilus gyrociliatus]|uniref:DgyrCDS4971 n=1 Tax=Dimorphilus gyrociliatus TaxID=2664684 RepID=A0A7I8VIG3_9ANNE|nr:DgyrCDS4971 [Dimorphilus gyrociliatus]
MADLVTGDEWRKCVSWLIRCKLISDDHRVNASDQVCEFVHLLRDGVILCNLCNVLSPESIPSKNFSQRPNNSQFLSVKNIKAFIQACNEFDLNPDDIFMPNDLYELEDIGKVLRTLSKLSRSPKARQSGIEGFGISASHNEDYFDLADRYSSFEQIHAYDDYGENDDKEEEIYEAIVYQRRRTLPSITDVRNYPIDELVETEKRYLELNLKMIKKHFMDPLRSIIPKDDFESIFYMIDDLIKVHTELCRDLINAKEQNSSIGAPFERNKMKFTVYGYYCSNLPLAEEVLQDLMKRCEVYRQKIQAFEVKMGEECGSTFPLNEILKVPMQRSLKYSLLLDTILKKTDSSHNDEESIKAGLNAMKDLGNYINEMKRDTEMLNNIKHIESSICCFDMPVNTELKDYGRLLMDGELKVAEGTSNDKKTRTIFLFDKVMVLVKGAKNDTYKYKGAVVLSHYSLFIENSSKQGRPWTFCLRLEKKTDEENAKPECFKLYARNFESQGRWQHAITEAHNHTIPMRAQEKGHDFLMFSYKDPTECSFCKRLLRGAFYQGYKCKKCEINLHLECVNNARKPHCAATIASDTHQNITTVRAIADFPTRSILENGDSNTYLTFRKDDVIQVIDRINSEWSKGTLRGQEGLFPLNYVRSLHDCERSESYRETRPVRPPLVPNRRSVDPSDMISSRRENQSNLEMLNYPWFIGKMTRDVACKTLMNSPSGTFLVRERELSGYALSIKFENSVKHIKIHDTNSREYYIAECKKFTSIKLLVQYYESNNLKHSFAELDTTLEQAYQQPPPLPPSTSHRIPIIGKCRVEFNYSATALNQLTIHTGEIIEIISKATDSRGWWKGRLHGSIGYFPHSFVTELEQNGN